MKMLGYLVALVMLAAPLVSAQTARLRADHPRLFVDAAKVRELREAVKGSHRELWAGVLRQAEGLAKQKPPAFDSRANRPSDKEQLWQREVGNKQPLLAMAYLISGERRFLEAAQAWTVASTTYPQWGAAPYDGTDLAAGHQLFGLAMVYDWLYRDLTPEARAAIRQTLIRQGDIMYGAATGKMYWRNSYLQNHLWVNITGLAAAGYALYDDAEAGERAKKWIAIGLEKMRRTEQVLGPDGASHEGVGYWDYGVEYMLKFWHMAGELMGERATSAWWPKTAAYRLHTSLPRDAWQARQQNIDYGDSPRHGWYGPDFLLYRLAALYQDPLAQELGAQFSKTGFIIPSASWLNLIWYAPSVPMKPPSSQPTLHHFDDMGIVMARSDWSGGESLVAFKCGPPVGHDAFKDPQLAGNAGHVHPDANHFLLFGAGDWLIKDDGYAYKVTGQHNTLLVDGKGQLDEGTEWFRPTKTYAAKVAARVLKAASTPEFDNIVGDATPVYPGVRRFVRRLLYLKPDVLIVVDEVAADEPHEFELRFHPENAPVEAQPGVYTTEGKKAALRLELLTPDDVRTNVEDIGGEGHVGAKLNMTTIRMRTQRAAWRNAVALSWSAKGTAPVAVTLRRDERSWTFQAGSRTVELPIGAGEPRYTNASHVTPR